ncbi:MAG: hypothetical protein WAT39_08485 [Planctomycetota bacterium]
MLDGVLERIIDASAGAVAGGLANPARPPVADQGWPNGLLDSPVVEAAVTGATSPPPGGAWTLLRHRILHDIGIGDAARVRRVRWLGLLAAAGIVCGAVLLANATEEAPTITFTDLATMPDVELSIVRHGALR